MMSTVDAGSAPRVEGLLEAAHRNYRMLCERSGSLTRCGIARDHLPEDVALMAFALLGDHDRAMLVEELSPHWQALHTKGLARASITETTTPELRLLSHSLLLADAVQNVWQRLQEVTDAPGGPRGAIQCAKRVQGLWGQPARLHFSALDVAYLLITPDEVFGLRPALLAAEGSGRCAGYFEFLVDDGDITFILQQRSGEVYRHVVHSVVERLS